MKSKAIKKIAALAAGITMVGATILGAMANLGDYPAPFVKEGQWNGVIVVGENAASSDVLGAIDLGASLQYDMKKDVSLGISVDPTINEGKKIERTGDKFNYVDDIYDITPTLDAEDLPVILAEGRYNDQEGSTDNKVDYSQKLTFYNNTETLKHVKDRESNDEKTDNYLVLDDHIPAYTYTLEFDSAVEYVDADDLKDTSINIQGQDYTITSVTLSGNYVDKIELLSGETVIWLQQGKTIRRPVGGINHEIEVMDVNDRETMCGISVDGDVAWIDKGATQTVNGVQIGVSDAVAVHAQLQDVDVCKLNVGATEITLKDGSEVKVNGYDIEGTEVAIDQSVANEMEWFSISATPEDDMYLGKDATWTDPALGKFGIRFAGMSAETEEMNADSSDDEASFNFLNNDGDEVEIPLIAYGGSIFYGDGDNTDYPATLSNGQRMIMANGDSCTGIIDATDCEGIKILSISSGKEARIFELFNVDILDGTMDIQDVTTGKTYDNRKFGDVELKLVTANIGLSADNKTITFNNIQAGSEIETSNLANVSFNAGPSVAITEDGGNVITFNYTWDAVDEAIQIDAVSGYVTMDKIEEGSDIKSGYTTYGTILVYDTDNKESLTIKYPKDEAYGNVFVAPTDAFVTPAGDLMGISIDPITRVSKLDSEIIDINAQNMIVVGGPCANSVAAKLMGNAATWPECAVGFTPGEALVKVFENGDNIALLVAGYSAEDTRLATSAISEHRNYTLTGNDMVVSTTSLESLKVSAPQ